MLSSLFMAIVCDETLIVHVLLVCRNVFHTSTLPVISIFLVGALQCVPIFHIIHFQFQYSVAIFGCCDNKQMNVIRAAVADNSSLFSSRKWSPPFSSWWYCYVSWKTTNIKYLVIHLCIPGSFFPLSRFVIWIEKIWNKTKDDNVNLANASCRFYAKQ